MNTYEIPLGFEAAHDEWLSAGGPSFHEANRLGPPDEFYRSRYWRLVKDAILTLAKHRCFRCQAAAQHVHHLNYYKVGTDHLHPATLSAVCSSCHTLVEYARLAESLRTQIERRISAGRGFMEDHHNCLNQDASLLYARILEYRDDLTKLRIFYEAETPHYTRGNSKELLAGLELRQLSYEEEAASFVSTLAGSRKEMVERVLPLLDLEVDNCNKFIAEVLAPVPPRAERLSPIDLNSLLTKRAGAALSEADERQERVKSEVESPVVGIKYHRGHITGIMKGESVGLAREPDNSHDKNAIRVHLKNGEILGYVTSELAEVLAVQMDSGNNYRVQVSRIVRGKVFIVITHQPP